jgi:hypothetical protein
MSEDNPITRAVEKKIARKINGGDPIEDMTRIEVSSAASEFEDSLIAKLNQVHTDWAKLQDDMTALKLASDSARWASSQRVFDIQVKSLERRLSSVSDLGTRP